MHGKKNINVIGKNPNSNFCLLLVYKIDVSLILNDTALRLIFYFYNH